MNNLNQDSGRSQGGRAAPGQVRGASGLLGRCPALRLLALPLALLAAGWPWAATVRADDPGFNARRNFGSWSEVTSSVVVGDVDGDGDLDLVVGNGGQNVVYLNDGAGNFYNGPISCSAPNVRCFGTGGDLTESVTLGDVDGDGNLDLVVGNGGQNVVYLNDGAGNFYNGPTSCSAPNVRCFGTGSDQTESVALGDVDGDGHLDLVAGNEPEWDQDRSELIGGENVVYLNDGAGNFPADSARPFGTGSDRTASVVLGDMDGDGDLDLVIGNGTYGGTQGEQNVVYLNGGAGNFYNGPTSCSVPNVRCFGTGRDWTYSVALGDVDGDDNLDLVVGNSQVITTHYPELYEALPVREFGSHNVVYLNDGASNFYGNFEDDETDCSAPNVRCFGSGGDLTNSVALGDVDGDGHLDLVVGNGGEENVVYLNDGAGDFPPDSARPFGTGSDATNSVALGDMDGDGDLDLVVGNVWAQNVVYLNGGAGNFPPDSARPFGTLGRETYSVALGDVDGDGYLDLVVSNMVYLNDGAGNFYNGPTSCSAPNVRCFGTGGDRTDNVVLGDVDGDGHLDLVVGNVVYLNDGAGNFYGNFEDDETDCSAPNVRCFGPGSDVTNSVVLGDVDGDGDLDLVVGNEGQNMVYLNDGAGNFPPDSARGFGTAGGSIRALGDMDGDGDLDVVVGNVVYLNDGAGDFPPDSARPFGTGDDQTTSVALGDVDGDGDLDVVVGNVVYLNDGAGNFPPDSARPFGGGGGSIRALGDMDGDGDLDVVVGNVVYLNDGAGDFPPDSARPFGTGGIWTFSVALGDVDGDGDLDLVVGKRKWQDMVYLNHTRQPGRLANRPPRVAVTRPLTTGNANFYSSPLILERATIPISYTLFDPEGDPVRFIRAEYSPDGGGRWYPASSTTDTQIADLPTSPSGETYTFNWDTVTSGFFGKSDNVVFRIEAYPSLRPQPNGVPGPYQWPYASATTFPFRVRGSQVRVLSEAGPVSGALVYRLPLTQSIGARPLASGAGQPFGTDNRGYLGGRGTLAISDSLVALLPITATHSYTLYHTSAQPITDGLKAYTVSQAGVQTLTVTAATPLILFNLNVSLEWDARKDTQFMSQLRYDLLRTSELLYDWTDGQAALGQVKVYHDRQKWPEADVHVYATNRLRPNATQGGIVTSVISDPVESDITYVPGQVRMGSVWNRYGEASGNLGEDWPRALAHELGHYLFYLDDDYLGLDENKLLVPVDSCGGSAMTDPYRDDYSEFHHGDGWQENCQATLAQQTTGRWDWQTIRTFYPALDGERKNPGPNSLPLAVTQVTFIEPVTPATTIDVPIFYLQEKGRGRYQPGGGAQAFLFQSDHLIDLGSPSLDQVQAHGARPGDRLCVYELAALDEPRLGCEKVTPGDSQMTLGVKPGWQPDVIVSPVNSTTITIRVPKSGTGLSGDKTLHAQLFPLQATASVTIPLILTAGEYSGTFNLTGPAFGGYVRVWVDEGEPPREIVTDFVLGGGPVPVRPRGGGGGLSRWWRRGRGYRSGYAPAVSTDGQVMLFGEDLSRGGEEFYALQAMPILPSPPSWTSVVGQAYRLITSGQQTDLGDTSISFSYLGSDVPPGEEGWLHIYFLGENQAEASWQLLTTTRSIAYNQVSAPVQGPGVYALMSSLEIPLVGGWNLVSYPVQETRPVSEALRSIDNSYAVVCGYDVTDKAWKIYRPGGLNNSDGECCPGLSDASCDVNDELSELRFGQGYWIWASQPTILRLRGAPALPADLVSDEPSPPVTPPSPQPTATPSVSALLPTTGAPGAGAWLSIILVLGLVIGGGLLLNRPKRRR